MTIRLRKRGPSISESDVMKLESKIGFSLPQELRVWLVEFNGGIPIDNLSFEVNGSRRRIVRFNRLFPDDQHAGLYVYISDIGDELSNEKLVPFALDDEFFPLCVDVSEAGHGGVVRLLNFPPDNELVAVSRQLIASSFEDFVSSLRIQHVEDDPVIEIAKHGSASEFRQLVENGFELDSVSKHGHTVGAEAAKHGNQNLMQVWIGLNGCLKNCLFLAAVNDHLEIVKMLIAAGADINERNKFGLRPIDVAQNESIKSLLSTSE